jgi:hypothetical protein
LEEQETEMTNIKYKENNLEKEQRKKNNKIMKIKTAEKDKKKQELRNKEQKILELSDTIERLNKQKSNISKKIKVE